MFSSESFRMAIVVLSIIMTLPVAATTYAQDTLLINYQGRLTDDSGKPITGTPSMTFTIYDGVGVSKWTESQATVEVDNGLFSVILGSHSALPDSVFTGEDRYLGIIVGGDSEISPRTLLTSAPGAAVARRVTGDVQTGESSLIIKDGNGDSSIVIDAGSGKGSPRMTFSAPPDPYNPSLELAASSSENSVKVGFAQPPDPYEPAVELSSNEAGSMVQVNWSIPPDPCREAIVLSADDSGNRFKVNWSQPPDPIQPAFEVFSDAVNEEVSMRLGQPPDPMIPEFEVTSDDMMTLLRLGQPPDPCAPGIELLASVESGPSINMYDDIGQVMGVDPSPFNEGISVKLLDPTDGGSLLELSGNHYSNEASIGFVQPPDREFMTMSTGLSTGASIKMFNPQPEPPALVMEMDVSESGGNWGGYFNMYSTEPLDNHAKTFEISNIGAAGANLKLFNPQPGKASTTAIEMYYDSLNGGGTISFRSDHDDSRSYITGRELYLGTDLGPSIYMHYAGAAYFAGQIGVGVVASTNILQIQQDSPTDPIADAWTTYSSKRWKRNIEPIEGALDMVENLRGVSFDWESSNKHDIGMIAEEVGEVVPEVVAYEENGRDARSIDYGRLTAVLVEAVKELKTENEELRSRLERLEAR